MDLDQSIFQKCIVVASVEAIKNCASMTGKGKTRAIENRMIQKRCVSHSTKATTKSKTSLATSISPKEGRVLA